MALAAARPTPLEPRERREGVGERPLQEVEGGEAYRLSKQLYDAYSTRTLLESDIATVKSNLRDLVAALQQLAEEAKQETTQQRQARAAEEALATLEHMKRLSEKASGAEDHMAGLRALADQVGSRAPEGGYY